MVTSNLAELRKSKRYSQAALAKVSGVNRGTIALIEEGKTKNATISTLLKLANALDVPVTSLFYTDNG